MDLGVVPLVFDVIKAVGARTPHRSVVQVEGGHTLAVTCLEQHHCWLYFVVVFTNPNACLLLHLIRPTVCHSPNKLQLVVVAVTLRVVIEETGPCIFTTVDAFRRSGELFTKEVLLKDLIASFFGIIANWLGHATGEIYICVYYAAVVVRLHVLRIDRAINIPAGSFLRLSQEKRCFGVFRICGRCGQIFADVHSGGGGSQQAACEKVHSHFSSYCLFLD